MSALSDVLKHLEGAWSQPRAGSSSALRIVCRFEPGIHPSLQQQILKRTLPAELKEFWLFARSADLFLDVTYGQWGLRLLAPYDSENETFLAFGDRADDFKAGDLIIGKFVGDSDCLIIRCDPQSEDFGSLMVATPIEPRSHWHHVSKTLVEFLQLYAANEGDKFWEQ